MTLFGGVIPITGLAFLMFCVFAILACGFLLGRITIKGISLGSAGVFIAALLFGCFFYKNFEQGLGSYNAKNALKIIENLGLILFVTSVGFIAGPKFFSNMKKNFTSYVMLGLIIIVAGGLTAVGCIFIGRTIGGETDTARFTAMVAGLLSGALTSTPAFSAAKETVGAELEDIVSVGNGIAYIFGVIGVVLFVQLIPKITKANMDKERALLAASGDDTKKKDTSNLITIDSYGIGAFALAAILGVFVGAIKIPLTSKGLDGTTFALTTTGGCLLMSLVFGHFGKIGKISVTPPTTTLKVFREIGLVLFLTGAGVAGGSKFVENFKAVYFIYGAVITLLPMIIGFLFSKYVLKLSMLNSLGSITGGMTSTPALGTLINVSGTEDVAAAYAATYPISLISVVLVVQFIVILF